MVVLQFIFSSFWVWLGFAILVCTVGGVVVEVVKTCKRSRKITAYRIGERWHITIEDASKGDAEQAIISTVYAPHDGQDTAARNETDVIRGNQNL